MKSVSKEIKKYMKFCKDIGLDTPLYKFYSYRFPGRRKSPQYKFQWEVLETILIKKADLWQDGDKDEFYKLNRFFDKEYTRKMYDDFIEKYKEALYQAKTHENLYRRSYLRIGVVDVPYYERFLYIEEKTRPVTKEIGRAETPRQLANAVWLFNRRIEFPKGCSIDFYGDWVDRYRAYMNYIVAKELDLITENEEGEVSVYCRKNHFGELADYLECSFLKGR